VKTARNVALRLRDPQVVEWAAAKVAEQTRFPRAAHWSRYSIAQGFAGLAVLWGHLDTCFPDEGWDVTGRQQLELAVRDVEGIAEAPLGLYSGLSGLAFGARQLSRNGTRYHRLLTTLDNKIAARAIVLADEVAGKQNGVTIGDFDVISGLSGVGAYLLCRLDSPAARLALSRVQNAMVSVTEERDGLPKWHTSAAQMWDESMAKSYPHGNLNCGLAHGVPGILAFLSLSQAAGFAMPGLEQAIAKTADWLCSSRCDDEWGVNWPTAVAIEEGKGGGLQAASAESAPDGPSRCAWCYGSPGVARALWLGAQVSDRSDYREVAVAAMKAVFRRPVPMRRIDSPTFCHGVAGLLAVALRFANDTGDEFFIQQSEELVRQILGTYRPESILGFRNLEIAGSEVDQPGLLDGSSGVALALLAAATNQEPDWDRLFLLS
jgi:hypothetical protein